MRLTLDLYVLAAWNDANVRARAEYYRDPLALSRLLETPCSHCRRSNHRRCSGRARPRGYPPVPCGCAEIGHPRRRQGET